MMSDVHGLHIAQKLLTQYSYLQIIFVTAHTKFAVDAFDIDATDYLLKPVLENRLLRALTKVQQISNSRKESQSDTKSTIMYAQILGSFQLSDVENTIVKWRTRKVRELFVYLWFYRNKPLSNTAIIEELWPEIEFEKASTNLHTTVYQLRKALKQNGSDNPILLVNNHYQLTIKIDSDYQELVQLLDYVQHNEQTIQQILNCYKGDFLAEEEYPWAINIRLRLKQSVLFLLETYIKSNFEMNPLLKLNCLQKMLELDEYNEEYMFMFLQFLIEQNKKLEAINFYTTIQQKLQEELGVTIPKNIQNIYAENIM